MEHKIIRGKVRINGSVIPLTLAVVAFLLVSFSTFSQPVIDQSHTGTSDWHVCLIDGQVLGQSFTAGKSGILARIEIDFFINPCPQLNQYKFRVEILDGDGYSGGVLVTKNVTVSIPFARSMLSVNFSKGPEITAGHVYTIRATAQDGQICEAFPANPVFPPVNVCAIWYVSQSDTYSGGIPHLNGAPDNVSDKYFTTYVLESGAGTIDDVTACNSYTWIDGNTYTASNNTATFTLTNAAGYDSLVILNLTIIEGTSSTDIVSACNSYTWIDGNTYTTSNYTATFSLTNTAGCDSLVTLNLTIGAQQIIVDQSHTGSNDWWTCLTDGQIIGQSFTAEKSGTLSSIEIDFLISPCSLLSLYKFTVEILEGDGYSGAVLATKDVTVSIPCARSMLSVSFSNAPQIAVGQTYTIRATPLNNQVCEIWSGPVNVCAIWFESQSDTYPGGIPYDNGTQDNVYDKYFLTYVSERTAGSTDVVTACNTFTWIDGNTYTTSNNTATVTLTNTAGCDSLVTLNLTIKENTSAIDVVSACNSYTWIDGNTYTTSNNTAIFTLVNATGCDSLVTLNLTIKESTSGIDVVSACNSYTWIDGSTYTTSNNTATFTFPNAAGCDSLVTLHLTIVTFDIGVTTTSTLTANAEGASYQWFNCDTNEIIDNAIDQSFSPSSSGTYRVEIGLDGCVGVSDCMPMVVTGIGQELTADFLVYPNPTAGSITLHVPDHLAVTELRLMNSLGQTLVQRAIVGSRTIELAIEGGVGLYFVEVKTIDGKGTRLKVLKK